MIVLCNKKIMSDTCKGCYWMPFSDEFIDENTCDMNNVTCGDSNYYILYNNQSLKLKIRTTVKVINKFKKNTT